MRTKNRPDRAAFTLLELVTAMTIMAIIGAVVMPVIVSASDTYAASREARASTERVLHALDRFARLVRRAPWAEDDSGLGVGVAQGERLEFEDGTGMRLDADTLVILDESGVAHALCTRIDAIEFLYLDAHGDAMDPVVPERIHRIGVRITSGGFTLSAYAMPRVWIGRGS